MWANIWRAFTQNGIEDGSGRVRFGAALVALWREAAISIQRWLDRKRSVWANVWRAFTLDGIEDGSSRVNLRAAMEALGGVIRAALEQLADNIGNWLGPLITGTLERTTNEHGRSLGTAFAQGLISGVLEGLLQRVNEWREAIAAFFQEGMDAAQDTLDMHSPSKKFEKIGQNIVAGLNLGLGNSDYMQALDLSGTINVAAANKPSVTFVNHFGRDSVRSDADIRAITEAQQRLLELQGVRGRIS